MFVRIIGYLCDSQAINILIKTRNEEKRSEGFSEFPDFGFFLFQTPDSKLQTEEFRIFSISRKNVQNVAASRKFDRLFIQQYLVQLLLTAAALCRTKSEFFWSRSNC